MKTNEKIRKYLDGEMSPKEISAFEKEAENSPELKKMIVNFRSTLKNYRELSSLNPEINYFNNIIPELRKTIEKNEKIRFSPAYAFGSFIIIIFTAVAILFISRVDPELQPDDKIISESLMDDEIEQFLNNYSSDYSYLMDDLTEDDSILDSLLSSELNLTAINFDLPLDFTNMDINNIVNNLSDKEFDGLYAAIINKKF